MGRPPILEALRCRALLFIPLERRLTGTKHEIPAIKPHNTSLPLVTFQIYAEYSSGVGL
jgi:hypothetical protein